MTFKSTGVQIESQKGSLCCYRKGICQEGWCATCQIYNDYQNSLIKQPIIILPDEE